MWREQGSNAFDKKRPVQQDERKKKKNTGGVKKKKIHCFREGGSAGREVQKKKKNFQAGRGQRRTRVFGGKKGSDVPGVGSEKKKRRRFFREP